MHYFFFVKKSLFTHFFGTYFFGDFQIFLKSRRAYRDRDACYCNYTFSNWMEIGDCVFCCSARRLIAQHIQNTDTKYVQTTHTHTHTHKDNYIYNFQVISANAPQTVWLTMENYWTYAYYCRILDVDTQQTTTGLLI